MVGYAWYNKKLQTLDNQVEMHFDNFLDWTKWEKKMGKGMGNTF